MCRSSRLVRFVACPGSGGRGGTERLGGRDDHRLVAIGGHPIAGDQLEVEVTTPAPPASRAQLERVLGGFFRIPGHRGLGLGLPLAGSILELHRGSLDIREEERVMRFIACFPVPERRRRPKLDPSQSGIARIVPNSSGARGGT